ncbi:MAG TPA: hypothetical protein VFF14_07995, partial [Candidatus Deferrimicrobium sp.]|nr:hypothetical protein [Candidatus Deferrimicrobium sp.]
MLMESAESKALISSDLTKKYGDKSALNNVRIQVGKGKEIRKQVGYVPQDIAIYDTINAKQNLQFFGSLYGMKGRDLDKRI